MKKTIRVKFSNGVFVPLEELDIEDGTELPVSFEQKYLIPLEERIKLTMSAAGAWKGKIDGEALQREIYEARRTGSRLPPDE